MPALFSLTITGAFVGLALGTLLPYPAPGACLGLGLATLLGTFIRPSPLFLPITGTLFAILGAFATMK